jgi:putative glutamine amidotransferase
MRPLIGIPSHATYRYGNKRPIYGNNRSYVHAIEDAGGLSVLIPFLEDLSELGTILSRLDGILLSGGTDVLPEWYGEEPHPLLQEGDPQLDALEFAVTCWALQENKPILGICRGIQLLNVALGGSLYQDVNDQCPGTIKHMNRDQPGSQLAHPVYIEAGSRMAEALGTTKLWVNSFHHQAVKVPGKGVRVTGRAEDGVVEAIEVVGHRFALGVQCHPEEIYQTVPAWARLFAAFVEACSVHPAHSFPVAGHEKTITNHG